MNLTHRKTLDSCKLKQNKKVNLVWHNITNFNFFLSLIIGISVGPSLVVALRTPCIQWVPLSLSWREWSLPDKKVCFVQQPFSSLSNWQDITLPNTNSRRWQQRLQPNTVPFSKRQRQKLLPLALVMKMVPTVVQSLPLPPNQSYPCLCSTINQQDRWFCWPICRHVQPNTTSPFAHSFVSFVDPFFFRLYSCA